MKLIPFKLEEFWKKYEFTAPYLLCPSDAEDWSLEDIIKMADPASRALWDNLHLGYTEVPGLPLLREEISKLYTSISADQIVTFAGGEEGIFIGLKTLLSPKDHVVIISPIYQSMETIARECGAEITTVTLEQNKKWKLSLEDLKKAFRPNTKLLIINYPNNPTGALLDKDVFEGMIALARKNGSYIFSDEMYRFCEIDESKRLPSLADAYEKGITLFGMTKPFGLAGLRIGWLASQDNDFLQRAASFKLYTSICNSAPSEILALIALRAKDKILKRNREIMLKNLKILDEFFERQKNKVSWVRPESGTIGFVELLMPIPIDYFTEVLVEKTGVLIMPGTVFDLHGNFFRIGFGRKDMPEILKRFEDFLNQV